MGKEVNANHHLLGRGKIYFDRMDSAGNLTGEFFLGNCPTFEITPTPEEIKKHSSASAAAALICSDVIRTSLGVTINGDEFSKENVARALFGDNSTLSQTASTVSDESITGVLQDRFYATLYRDISTVVVTDDPMTTTYVAGTDYDVDAVTGRIYIIAGGGIADDDDILVSYAYGTIALNTVRGMNQSSIRGLLRFIGDPARGPKYEVICWRVSVRADGAIGFISDEYGSWSLTGEMESDATNHPNEPHYLMIELE